jgi:uncharacterized protein (TIGR02145 family)
MKKIVLFIAGIALLGGIATAQDTLYIHQQGGTITKIAVNKIDSMVFNEATITTPPLGTVTVTYGSMTDGESNSYKTVSIGTQTWMAENLKVTKYNDGTTIPNVTDATTWSNLTTGAVCTYNNTTNADSIRTYGRLYNWYAVNTGKLCPTGWHVPSDAEWSTLDAYLNANGYDYDGSTTDDYIAKSMASTTGWASFSQTGDIGNNPSINNKSGFTALPGGRRSVDGAFYGVGGNGYWWSSTENYSSGAGYRYLGCSGSGLSSYYIYKVSGFSVRCLRD